MAVKKIIIKINQKKVFAKVGQTILQVARKNNIDIPALCYHPDLKVKANCRLCLVEIKGKKGLFTACSTPIKPKMEVVTESPKIARARRTNLELIFAQHKEECNDCIYLKNCELLRLARKYQVKIDKYKDRKSEYPTYKFGPALIFDSSKCIDCRACVEVCQNQAVNFLEIKDRGHLFKVVPSKNKDRGCVYCGQCLVHCPVGAFEGASEFEKVEEPISDPKKIVVFQFAPAVRASIGEEFGVYGKALTKKLVGAIRALGVKYVFDVCVGADVTTVEEAGELIERLKKNQNLPMFTSCCPAWVRFIELYYPNFISNLTTVRSPHIISGGLVKTFWAKQTGFNPKDIMVVSIMPCVAKKYEITRSELKINHLKPVDYVLTVRELAFLLIKHKIDLNKVKPAAPDSPLGNPSGAGVIYGASGGVMESALRTAYEKICQCQLKSFNFKKVRGDKEFKVAKVDIGKVTLKVAVVNGLGNAKKVLEQLKKEPRKYDYIEVMSCPGGCIGGGGQPVPTDSDVRKSRAKALYNVDSKKAVRLAHRNPEVIELYNNFFTDHKLIHKICYTCFSRKKSRKIRKLKK